MRWLPAIIVGAALEVAGLAALEAQPGRPLGTWTVLVEDWSRQRGRIGVPDGWELQSRARPKYDLRVEEISPETGSPAHALHLRTEEGSVNIGKPVGPIDVTRYPVLQWRWRVVTLPTGGNSSQAATDDQAAQIYVVFPRFPAALRSRLIGYVWDTTLPAGSVVKSESARQVTYVVVRSGASDLGKWILESRNVYEDYRRIYGEEPAERIEAVAVGIDSNDTRSHAEAYLGEILFRTH